MQYKNRKLRHEMKYMISYADYYALKARLSVFMEPDRHAGEEGYFIRSLYFDDIYNSAYEEKEAGIARRSKYRIRAYNYDSSVIKFEIKDKFDGYISKKSAKITLRDFYDIINENYDFLLDCPNSILREIFIAFRMKRLRPRVMVDYSREAFICREGNVRITFDKNLRAGISTFDMFDENAVTIPAFAEGYMIMEIKYDNFLPSKISRLVMPLNRWQTALSKYIMCRDACALYYKRGLPYGADII